jgi:hypothetical protein
MRGLDMLLLRMLQTPSPRLRRRPRLARGDGGGPSTQQRPAAAVRREVWRGFAQSGQATQDGLGWRLKGLPGSRVSRPPV